MRKFENDFRCNDCRWEQSTSVMDKNGDEKLEWVPVDVTAVPVGWLLREYEDLVFELSEKEVLLSNKKEEYANKEFEIVFMSDVNFKELYGSTSEKVRKQHAKTELSELDNEIKTLELSINWIRGYIPLLKEVIRCKR